MSPQAVSVSRLRTALEEGLLGRPWRGLILPTLGWKSRLLLYRPSEGRPESRRFNNLIEPIEGSLSLDLAESYLRSAWGGPGSDLPPR